MKEVARIVSLAAILVVDKDANIVQVFYLNVLHIQFLFIIFAQNILIC